MSANQCKDNQFPTSTHLWNCGWNSTLPQHCSISPFIVSKCDWRAQFVWVKCWTWWGKTRERERKRDLLSFNFSPFIKEGINRGEFSTAFQWGEVLSVKGLVWFKLAWETCDRFTWKAARGLSVNNSLPVYFCLSAFNNAGQIQRIKSSRLFKHSEIIKLFLYFERERGKHYLSVFVRENALYNDWSLHHYYRSYSSLLIHGYHLKGELLPF